jgi:prevent-host-death family protein
MKHVPVAAFKDRVSEYVAEAQAGAEIVITRHGKEAARLVPPLVDAMAVRERRRNAVQQLLAFREAQRARGNFVSVEEWIEWKNEGRP